MGITKIWYTPNTRNNLRRLCSCHFLVPGDCFLHLWRCSYSHTSFIWSCLEWDSGISCTLVTLSLTISLLPHIQNMSVIFLGPHAVRLKRYGCRCLDGSILAVKKFPTWFFPSSKLESKQVIIPRRRKRISSGCRGKGNAKCRQGCHRRESAQVTRLFANEVSVPLPPILKKSKKCGVEPETSIVLFTNLVLPGWFFSHLKMYRHLRHTTSSGVSVSATQTRAVTVWQVLPFSVKLILQFCWRKFYWGMKILLVK